MRHCDDPQIPRWKTDLGKEKLSIFRFKSIEGYPAEVIELPSFQKQLTRICGVSLKISKISSKISLLLMYCLLCDFGVDVQC